MAKLNRRHRPTVQAFRAKCGLSQGETAKILDLSRLFISQIETGYRQPSRPVQLLVRIFEAYPDVLRDRMAELEMRRGRRRRAPTQDHPD